MADNRMAIICKRCKLGIAIAKYYMVEGWGRYPLNEGRVNEFFNKHADCGKYQYYLGYESEDDWMYDTVGMPEASLFCRTCGKITSHRTKSLEDDPVVWACAVCGTKKDEHWVPTEGQ